MLEKISMRWQLKKLIWVHVVLLLIAVCYCTPLTFSWIRWVDVKAAYAFNGLLFEDPFWHRLWKFFRSPTMDCVYDGIMFLFALYYIFTKEKVYLRKSMECIILVLFTIACFMPIHRGPVHKAIRPVSRSPLGVMTDLTLLSETVTGWPMKGVTHHSFPSDHGYTVFMFVFSCLFLRGWRFALVALICSFPVMSARIVIGIHWLSDLTFGSIPIVFFNLAWLFYSPLFVFLVDSGARCFRKEVEHVAN